MLLPLACNSPVHLLETFVPLVVVGLPVTAVSAYAVRRTAESGPASRPPGPSWTSFAFAAFEAAPLALLGAALAPFLPRDASQGTSDMLAVPLPLAVMLTLWVGLTLASVGLSRARVPHPGAIAKTLGKVILGADAVALAIGGVILLATGGGRLGIDDTLVGAVLTVLMTSFLALPFLAVGCAIGRRRARVSVAVAVPA